MVPLGLNHNLYFPQDKPLIYSTKGRQHQEFMMLSARSRNFLFLKSIERIATVVFADSKYGSFRFLFALFFFLFSFLPGN